MTPPPPIIEMQVICDNKGEHHVKHVKYKIKSIWQILEKIFAIVCCQMNDYELFAVIIEYYVSMLVA